MLASFTIFFELIFIFLINKTREFGILDLHNNQHLSIVITSLFLLFLGYFLVYFFLDLQKASIRIIFLMMFVFHITFLFVPFISSNDLYSYIFTTRVNGIFGENPYFMPYNSFPQDPLYQSLRTIWADHTTLYGPILLHIGGFLNQIGQNNLLFLTYIFKSLFIGANLINIFLVYKITQNKQSTFLFGVNPLMIYELSGNSHTESLTLLFLLLSIYLLYKKPVLGFTCFVLAVLIKYYPLLFLPLYLIRLAKEGTKSLIFSIILGVLITIIIYFPFWKGLQNFDYLMSYYYGQYISPSPLIWLGERLLGSYTLSFQINTVIFLGVAVVLMYKFWRSKAELKHFLFYSFLLYWAYILTKSSLILVWYLILLLLLASLCMAYKEYQKYATSGIVFVTVYSLILYYFVR